MRIIGVIPARYKSSRFPGKPLCDIHGKPMIWWVCRAAQQAEYLDEVYVATDDERILEACKQLSLNVIMTSEKHPTGTDRVAEVAQKIEAELYVNIQGDEPMLKPETITAAIEPFLLKSGDTLWVSNLMTPIRTSSEIIDVGVPKVVVNEENEAVFLSRAPIPYPKETRDISYMKQVCAYGFRPQALKAFASLPQGPCERAEGIEILRFIEHGIKVQMVEVDSNTMAVDTPSDLKTVRRLMEEQRFD